MDLHVFPIPIPAPTSPLFFKNCVRFRRKERKAEVTHPPSLCVSVYLFLSYKDTLVGFWVHFKLIVTLTLLTSAKILFPNKVTFWVWGDMDIWETLFTHSTSMLAQKVKNLLEMQETQVHSLGQEDPQEKAIATHSSILAWRLPWTEEPGRLQFMGWQSQTWLNSQFLFSYTHNTHRFTHDIQLFYLTLNWTEPKRSHRQSMTLNVWSSELTT